MNNFWSKLFGSVLAILPFALIAGIFDYRFHNYFWPKLNWFRLFKTEPMFDFASIFASFTVVFIIAYLLMMIFDEKRRSKLHWHWSFTVVALVFFGGTLATFSYEKIDPVIKSFPVQFFTNYASPVAIFTVLFFTLGDKKFKDLFERWFLVAFGILGASIILEFFGDFFPGENRDFLGRLIWPYIDPFFDLKAESANWVAFLFGPIALLSMLRHKEKWPILVGIISIFVVLLSKSYTSIVILSTLIFYYVFWQLKRHLRKWVVVTAMVVSVILIGFQYDTPKFKILIGNYDYSKANSIERRIQIYKVTWVAFKKNWLYGIGPGNYQNYFKGAMGAVLEDPIPEEEVPPHPHNLAMNFWSDLGIFGLLAILIVYLITGWNVLVKRTPYFFILAYPLGHGLIDTPYGLEEVSVIFWILMALTVNSDD